MKRPEKALQKMCMYYIRVQYPKAWEMTFHPKNEGSKNWDAEFMANSAGVPDIIIDYPSAKLHGFRAEIKDNGVKPRENQIEWQHNYLSLGYYAVIVDSFEEFKQAIDSYMRN